ncbi:MAG: OsmC family protein [Saprospiraceae bacterium]|nr:OsmC family protein [Saprospiraceae bacterium]
MKSTVVTATSDSEKLYTEVKTADKNFFVDEPIEIGGTDLAPNPIEYFLGSLAACTTITLQLYAKRKGWNTGKIEVIADLDTNDSQDKKIIKTIRFENQLSTEQIERLLAIAEICPVAKLISEAVPMRIN